MKYFYNEKEEERERKKGRERKKERRGVGESKIEGKREKEDEKERGREDVCSCVKVKNPLVHPRKNSPEPLLHISHHLSLQTFIFRRQLYGRTLQSIKHFIEHVEGQPVIERAANATQLLLSDTSSDLSLWILSLWIQLTKSSYNIMCKRLRPFYHKTTLERSTSQHCWSVLFRCVSKLEVKINILAVWARYRSSSD